MTWRQEGPQLPFRTDQRKPNFHSAETRGAPAPIPPSPEGPQLSFRRDQRGPKSHSAEIRGFPTPIPQRPERARRHGFSWKLSSDPGTNKPDTARLWLFLEPFQFESVSNQVSCPLPARQRAKGLSSRSLLSTGAYYQVDMLGVRYKSVNFRAKNSLFDQLAWPKQPETVLGFQERPAGVKAHPITPKSPKPELIRNRSSGARWALNPKH